MIKTLTIQFSNSTALFVNHRYLYMYMLALYFILDACIVLVYVVCLQLLNIFIQGLKLLDRSVAIQYLQPLPREAIWAIT